MKLSNMVQTIKEKRWTKINNYYIDILFAHPNTAKEVYGPIDFAKLCGWDIDKDDLNAALISVTTPTYTNALVSQYVSYEWRFHQGRDEIYRFSMTFRDYDQMKLYNAFRTLYIKGKEQYFDKIKMNIQIFMDADIGFETPKPIFQTGTAIIENVSQLQFSHNTENQVAEFTVSFVANTNEVNGASTTNSGNTLFGATKVETQAAEVKAAITAANK